ncbi:MAG TPA: squalene synthase HpnC [Tepidisphaeraceae bacterium]|nr:squalene synthase HpnC [Tepidisphaeraceae bacterium]
MSASTIQMAGEAASDAQAAQAQTRRLANSHYENFSVVSLLLPRNLRQDFCNVYAFCRVADDLGDETGDRDESLRLLADFRQQTLDCYAGRAATPVFVALSGTIERHQLPAQPFLDLIDAFEQDQRMARYQTYAEVLDYCRRSANPVGRLVLYLCGYRDEVRQILSDQTCTALQLANFWQDVRRDILQRDRIYIPRDSMDRFGITEQQILAGQCDENFRSLIRFEVNRTAEMFGRGAALLPLLRPSVRLQVSLFGKGGRAVLAAIRRQNYDTLSRRPALSKLQKGGLIFSTLAAFAGRLLAGGRR